MDKFLKIIKSIFGTNQEVTDLRGSFPLGAFLNEQDNRDIPYSMVSASIAPFAPKIEVPGFISTPRLEQGQLGTCVTHAFEFIRRNTDGIVHSRRIPYVITRNALLWDKTKGQGLPQREAAKTVTIVGLPKDMGVDDNTLSHELYTALSVTKEIRDDANIYRFGGFAFPHINIDGIKQALADGKLVAVTLGIDWNAIDKNGTIHPPKNLAGFHEVVIGMCNDDTRMFRFANWWGKDWGTNGDGFISYGDIEKVVYDAITFVDIPEDLKIRAKQTQFIFTSDLSFGSNSLANIQLQRRLAAYGVFNAQENRQFGMKTLQAVKDYQRFKGIPQTGFVGQMTRRALNNDVGSLPIVKSKIDLWCEAAIKMEGAKSENHNPGNIRFVGQKEAIGQDYRGFCIFSNDAVGYKMLRDTFVRAASGNSLNYRAEETLYEFYAGIPLPNRFNKEIGGYAPASDKNSPNHYAEFVAKYIGVSPSIAIKNLLV